MGANTPWEKMFVSTATAVYLQGKYELWSRLLDGQHVFVVVTKGNEPLDNYSSYDSISSALGAKGLL